MSASIPAVEASAGLNLAIRSARGAAGGLAQPFVADQRVRSAGKVPNR
ncbi:MAG: hypothetical protein ACK4YQ_16145 [Phenylobacterium sp.]